VLDQFGEVTAAARRRGAASAALEDTAAAILYTSGTTGEPRGALAGHALLRAGARNLNELLGADAEAPFGLAVPASHAFGLACLLSGIRARATAILVDVTSSLEPLTAALWANRGTVLHGSPALFRRFARLGGRPAVRTGLTAGSHCPPKLLENLDAQAIRILNLYGTTEVGAACSCRSSDPPLTRYRTVGRALAGYEIRLAPISAATLGEATGAARTEAQIEEIQVRSEYLLNGYYRRPWDTEELVEGGWLRTGDLGRVDAAGNVSITGRAKELVLVGGFSVFPAEVESFLLTHPGIEQAAVVGRPHPSLGEALHAFVVAADGVNLEPPEVVRFAREGIAGYKVPYVVTIVSELPSLPSGKPDRRALSDLEIRDPAGRGGAVLG
jgi:acyl-CoA synthetase (AMP-forming)/AMP-acid ligase II